jgi:NADH-quinone oxidoreductase subunit N
MTVADLLFGLQIARPELILALGAMAALMVGAFRGDRSFQTVNAVCFLILIAAGAVAVLMAPAEGRWVAFNGSFAVDRFAAYAKALIAFAAAGALLLSIDFLERKRIERPEYPVLVVMAVLGMFVMASANDLIALYIGVEMQSLCLYVLAAYARDDQKSSEAGLKYFVLGALSSGLLLYGASLVYGFIGSVNYDAIAQSLAGEERAPIGVVFGLVFLLCGIGFKISAAPFHMWTPDVYEGAPTPATAFFAAAPKVAALALLARLLFEAFGSQIEAWRQIVSVMAVLSMAVGALGALRQTNIKRLMAYSSITNMGYALVAIAAGPDLGGQALLIFLTIYAVTSVGMFGTILAMRRDGGPVEAISDLAGLSRTKPWLALAFTALIFSVMGIPPLAGFLGKLQILLAAAASGQILLAAALVIASVISAFYYLRLIKIMWFDEPAPGFLPAAPTLTGAIVGAAALAFPVMVLGMGLIDGAARLAGAALR